MKRNIRRRGEVDARRSPRASFTSTEAQNNFGQVLDQAAREGPVFITRYDRPQAVVLSMEEYARLIGEAPVDLQALQQEFDAMLEGMQRPEHRRAVDALFSMSGTDLGRTAAGSASKRG